MITVIVSHEVKDYSAWRPVYDADEVNRAKAGFKIQEVYRSIADPNQITLIGEAPNVESVQTFMTNPELKKAMEKGGVISEPEVKVLSKA